MVIGKLANWEMSVKFLLMAIGLKAKINHQVVFD